jgi:hypothetical protein
MSVCQNPAFLGNFRDFRDLMKFRISTLSNPIFSFWQFNPFDESSSGPGKERRKLYQEGVEQHAESMYRLAFRLTDQHEPARELVQET